MTKTRQSSFLSRFSAMLRRRRLRRRVKEEVEFHIRMETEEYVRLGMALPDARTAARRKVGNTTKVLRRFTT